MREVNPGTEPVSQDSGFAVFFPYALEWRITDSCDRGCLYCTNHNNNPVRDIDYPGVLERIEKLSPRHLWIGGGEPSIVPDLPRIIKSLRERTPAHIGVNTNLANPESIKKIIPYIDDLIISLDTLNRELSLRYRKVDPEEILGFTGDMVRFSHEGGYGVNFSVNSVVFYESLHRPGLAELNDRLNDIDRNITHILCPLYPAERDGSIILDSASKEVLKEKAGMLRKKKRKVHIDFPEFEKPVKVIPVKCFRRYFRVQMIEDGDMFSPCPPAPPEFPWCLQPCNAACFIEDIINGKPRETLLKSPFRGRLSREEVGSIESFLGKHIKSGFKKGSLGILSEPREG